MQTRRVLLAAASILLAIGFAPRPAAASNGSLWPYFDGWGTCKPIPCGGMVTLRVYAFFAGASLGGITGAEYKVRIGPDDDADPAFFYIETFDLAATVLGTGAFNPVDPGLRGVNVAWPTCQTGLADGYVVIETVQIFNAGCSTAEVRLQVVKHDTASNPFFQCPLFVLCDAPVYTKVCIGYDLHPCRNPEPPFANDATCSTGGFAYINRPPCPPAVEPASWSAVKRLYRD